MTTTNSESLGTPITRRTFVKRTGSTAIVAVLATHCFRHEAFAEEGGVSSKIYDIFVVDHDLPGWPNVTTANGTINWGTKTTSASAIYKGNTYTLTVKGILTPNPITAAADGNYYYRDFTLEWEVTVVVTHLGSTLFSATYYPWRRIQASLTNDTPPKLRGSAGPKPNEADMSAGDVCVIKCMIVCADGNPTPLGVRACPTVFGSFCIRDAETNALVCDPASVSAELTFERIP
jgi:hypothetical protein